MTARANGHEPLRGVVELSGAALGTRFDVRLIAPRGADRRLIAASLEQAVEAVDRQASAWRADSDLVRLEAAPIGTWVPVPSGLASVLAAALRISRITDGAFDVDIGAAMAAHGFGPPRPVDCAAGVPVGSVGHLELDVASGHARRTNRVSLDLWGLARGFAVDEMARVLDLAGIEDYVVSVGRRHRARGSGPSGDAWTVLLERPDDAGQGRTSSLALADEAVATSGDWRTAGPGGERPASRVFDPRTGQRPRHGQAMATVVAETCMEADALATALQVMEPQAGLALARERRLEVLVVSAAGDGCRQAGTGRFSR